MFGYGWRFASITQKLNDATRKDHFPLPFMDQMLERLAGNKYYCFLDGFSSYFQIPIDPLDQEKTLQSLPIRYICLIVRMPLWVMQCTGNVPKVYGLEALEPLGQDFSKATHTESVALVPEYNKSQGIHYLNFILA
ncbi:hypothetical protein Tco_1252206 [Tanacetum coccineum]